MTEIKTVKIADNKIRLLTENNYNDWLVNIRAILRSKKLWKYATESYVSIFNSVDSKKLIELEISNAKAENTEWKNKTEETIDYMTPTIDTKMKNKLKNEHFNNSYKMLLRIKEELKLIDDAQFMRLTKKYYSLNIKDFIERIMGDYHSIALNLVILVTYMEWKHRKCAGAKALVPTRTH